MKKFYIIFALVVLLIAVVVFYANRGTSPEDIAKKAEQEAGGAELVTDWQNVELKDVLTNQTFKISDFSGTPVLLESFAVWCPTCLKQQKEIGKLKKQTGDDIVHISLDTDPNEDEAKVLEHAKRHGFDWYFSVSPINLTNELIDQFGLGIVSAPAAPAVLICGDGSARMLGRGVKTAAELKQEVASCK